jgi:predicted nucleic acid-binding Zn ribbon protein
MSAASKRRSYHRGRWQLARERLRLTDTAPAPPAREPAKIGSAIAGVLKKLGLENTQWTHVLGEQWPELVGAAVAGHTRPGRFENGVLVVFVDSSVWFSELSRYGQARMLENLQKAFGKKKIRNVRLQLDPDGQQGA